LPCPPSSSNHARLDKSRNALVADLTRDRIDKFPGFDKDEFERLSDQELDRFGKTTAAACCPSDDQVWDSQIHYRQPDWWQSGFYRPESMVGSDSTGRSS